MSLKSAYKTSGEIFRQVSKMYQPGLLDQMKAIKNGEIVVVRGQYDHIETLLDTMKLPYELISPKEVASHNGGRVMFVNCSSYDCIDKKTKDTVKEFVNDGGRLVTTDWSLGFVLGIFPGKYKKIKDTAQEVVEVQCTTDLSRKLLGLNYAQCHPKWWLEGSSHIYEIKDGVVPIITSNEMEAKYGKPYVATGFTEGKGEAIHFISHLELQKTKLSTKEDKKGLETFLKNMKISKTAEMDDDLMVAELEAAYSTLNTLAYLCLPSALLNPTMKSVMLKSNIGGEKSKALI